MPCVWQDTNRSLNAFSLWGFKYTMKGQFELTKCKNCGISDQLKVIGRFDSNCSAFYFLGQLVRA